MTVTRCGECGTGFIQPDPSASMKDRNGRELQGAARQAHFMRLVREYYQACSSHVCETREERTARWARYMDEVLKEV
jgi:hypothetical protein